MAEKKVYMLPQTAVVDGINVQRHIFPILFKERIDERKLTRENDVLVATYPRTGERRYERTLLSTNIVHDAFFLPAYTVCANIESYMA